MIGSTAAFFRVLYSELDHMFSNLAQAAGLPAVNQTGREEIGCGDLALPEVRSGRPSRGESRLRYCYRKPSKQPDRIVFFFHGFTNDHKAQLYNPVLKFFRKEWQKQGHEVLLISLSFGASKLMPLELQGSGKVEELMQRLLAQISQETELDLSEIPPTLVGDSMGGHNALLWWVEVPEAFDRLALFCPAIPGANPFFRRENLRAFPFFADLLFRIHYRSLQDWEYRSPLAQVLNVNPASVPDHFTAYIGIVQNDIYEFEQGPLTIAQILKQKGVSTKTELRQGAHCQFYSESLAAFIVGHSTGH
jgi:pimeloyl-ACP methyl ester carboxylesterase